MERRGFARRLFGAFDKTPVLREYRITTEKLPAGEKLAIALISDLHGTSYGKGQEELLNLLRSSAPDFIAMTGDIFDDRRPAAPALRMIRAAASIAPVYYVTGNHEYGMYAAAAKKHAAFCGARVLQDSLAVFGRGDLKVIIGGIDDSSAENLAESAARLRRAFSKVKKSGMFSVLLAHRPGQNGEYGRFGFDLVLSGHNHGGQVRIPGVCEGVFSPAMGLFPRWPGGVYRAGGQTHVVSRGLAVFPLLPRVFNPPEIVAVTVSGTMENVKCRM